MKILAAASLLVPVAGVVFLIVTFPDTMSIASEVGGAIALLVFLAYICGLLRAK